MSWLLICSSHCSLVGEKIFVCCKECRAEAIMKTEDREKEDAGLMGAWSHAQYAGERESEREKTEIFYSKL